MSSKKEQNRRYYLRHKEERITYSKKYWEEKAKAYKIPDLGDGAWRYDYDGETTTARAFA